MSTFSRCLIAFLLGCSLLPPGGHTAERMLDVAITPYPDASRRLDIGKGLRLVDYSVSPTKPVIALLLREASGQQVLKFWNVLDDRVSEGVGLGKEIKFTWVSWHPVDDALFLLGKKGAASLILRADQTKRWKPSLLLSSEAPIQRLVIGPRPFDVGSDGEGRTPEYRLFFGVKKGNSYATDSITEYGHRRYQVMGEGPQYALQATGEEFPPSEIPSTKGSALPVGFHPAGNRLVWQDAAGCFNSVGYERDHWGATARPLYDQQICKGELWLLPNGAGVLHWLPKQPGYMLYLGVAGKLKRAETTVFDALPIVTPDGKGVIGLMRTAEADQLLYEPTSIPLGDVVNAWMFGESAADLQRLEKHGGMFRSRKNDQQLFQLYETEQYQCGGYDPSTPSRPYIVTTDIFWETAAAAYEGLFVVSEQKKAIPAFWQFVSAAHEEMSTKPGFGKWQKVFDTLLAIRRGVAADPLVKEELAKIRAEEDQPSKVVGPGEFLFSNLKPRGYYTQSAEAADYFRAFRYFVQASEMFATTPGAGEMAALGHLSPGTRAHAERWVRSYLPFIAAARADLVWGKGVAKWAAYAREPKEFTTVFPLSWGFDNEALFNTVYHPHWPAKDVIAGAEGPRFLPSSLDLAAILGSELAESILEESGEFSRYPQLRGRIAELGKQGRSGVFDKTNLYDSWLAALAVQWSGAATVTGNEAGKRLYQTKRLQTGLASWATLRHATVLVNERSGAECGEGGFEPVILQFPRGYVETDPATFEAIAGFLDAMAGTVVSVMSGDKASEAMRGGILRRLEESAATARHFKAIAEKEIKNLPLTQKEYEDIFYVGRAAEHNFLVFKSLMRAEQAIANPDPIPKVADVAGKEQLLNAAVGEPLEWDFIFPALGRRMVGKGSVYSFYEFVTDSPMNDEEWRAALHKTRRPAWVERYMNPEELSCPARPPL